MGASDGTLIQYLLNVHQDTTLTPVDCPSRKILTPADYPRIVPIPSIFFASLEFPVQNKKPTKIPQVDPVS